MLALCGVSRLPIRKLSSGSLDNFRSFCLGFGVDGTDVLIHFISNRDCTILDDGVVVSAIAEGSARPPGTLVERVGLVILHTLHGLHVGSVLKANLSGSIERRASR